jgi:hypothetical protein
MRRSLGPALHATGGNLSAVRNGVLNLFDDARAFLFRASGPASCRTRQSKPGQKECCFGGHGAGAVRE